MAAIRRATAADCLDCREAWRNKTPRPCWSLASAVVVPLYRSTGPGHYEAVEAPRCFSRPGWKHAPRVVPPEVTR
jgi:hypothetical protein